MVSRASFVWSRLDTMSTIKHIYCADVHTHSQVRAALCSCGAGLSVQRAHLSWRLNSASCCSSVLTKTSRKYLLLSSWLNRLIAAVNPPTPLTVSASCQQTYSSSVNKLNSTLVPSNSTNNDDDSHDNVYGAVIMTQSHCESSPGSSDECRLSAGWPPTLRPSQSTWAVSPPKTGSYHPHPPSPLLLLPSP